MGERFNKVDEPFNVIDERFTQWKERFTAIDSRLDKVESDMKLRRTDFHSDVKTIKRDVRLMKTDIGKLINPGDGLMISFEIPPIVQFGLTSTYMTLAQVIHEQYNYNDPSKLGVQD